MRVKPNALSLFGNELWCACELSQNLIRIDILTNVIEEVSKLPFELRKDSEEYVLIYAYDEGILLAPNVQSTIYIYKKREHKWQQIDFEKIGNGGQLYSCSIGFDQSVYMFPGSSDNITVYNTSSGKIEQKRKLLSYINSRLNTSIMVINPVCQLDEHRVVGTTSVGNYVFIYNVLNDQVDMFTVGDDGANYSSCLSLNGAVVLYDKNNCLLRMINEERQIINEIKMPNGGYRVLKYSDEIVLLDSVYGNDLYIIEASLNNYVKCQKGCGFTPGKSNVLGRIIHGDNLTYYYNRVCNSICSINLNGIIESQEMPVLGEKIKKSIIENSKGKIITESKELSLSEFLSMVSM